MWVAGSLSTIGCSLGRCRAVGCALLPSGEAKFPAGCPGASRWLVGFGEGRRSPGGAQGAPKEGEPRLGLGWVTLRPPYLLSLHSLRSLTRSHLRRRKRFRLGDALGVEQLDHGVSSSLDGVISMEGSCRNSFPGRSRPSPASRLCSCTFLVRRILKRRRRRVGVDELDHAGPPSGAPCASGTCRAGSCRFSIMLAAGIGTTQMLLLLLLAPRSPLALPGPVRPAQWKAHGANNLSGRALCSPECARAHAGVGTFPPWLGLDPRPFGFRLGSASWQPRSHQLRAAPLGFAAHPLVFLPLRSLSLATSP